jgi:hypothetical protein
MVELSGTTPQQPTVTQHICVNYKARLSQASVQPAFGNNLLPAQVAHDNFWYAAYQPSVPDSEVTSIDIYTAVYKALFVEQNGFARYRQSNGLEAPPLLTAWY